MKKKIEERLNHDILIALGEIDTISDAASSSLADKHQLANVGHVKQFIYIEKMAKNLKVNLLDIEEIILDMKKKQNEH